jgi:DNA-binding LytR/AlgR family response regulator
LYHVASLYLFVGIIEVFYYNHKTASIANKHIHSNFELARQKLDSVKTEIIHISLEHEQIEIARNKLVYIQSMGNYLQFCLREPNGDINKITKRGRLQSTEKDLTAYSEFIRCHRAFIVNLQQPASLKGNIKNAKIIFEGELEKIPVSRTKYKSLKKRLEQVALT